LQENLINLSINEVVAIERDNMKTKIFGLVTLTNVLLSAGLFALLTSLSPLATAQVSRQSSDFNHLKTGFPLTGAHTRVECETCHAGGLFKGTATDCAGCHSPGRRVVAPAKSLNHMPTNAACNICHTNTVTFIGARFNHMGVQPKACATCHNGRVATGKITGHIQTTHSCDSCHRTSAWIPAGFDHAPPLATCASCHSIPANHVPVPAGVSCDSCHKSGFATFLGAVYDHVGSGVLPGTCATCHITGQYGAKRKTANHIPTGNISCDACHANYASFIAPTMNHSVVEAAQIKCSSCHNGSFTSEGAFLGGAKAKTPNHPVTTAECGTCHLGRSSFLGGAAFNHAGVTPGSCASCHNGINAIGKTNTPTHNGTIASCDTCHGTANGYTSFAGAAFNHTGVVAGTCGTCHLGQSASVKTKSITHIPTTGNACDACHLTTISFLSPVMQHSAVTSIACATCHNGSYLKEQQAQKPCHQTTL
jgi:Cytochrome c7 and related cytochrome c